MKTSALLLSFICLVCTVCAEETMPVSDPIRVSEIEVLADQLAAEITSGNYNNVIAALKPIKEGRRQSTDGGFAYDILVDYLAERVDGKSLEKWIGEAPDSSIPYTIMGEWAINEAWDKRGSGWASSVKEEGWKGFAEYLEMAQENLEMAYVTDPKDYVACALMIRVMMGMGDRDGIDLWFNRAIELDDLYYSAYSQKSWALYPRWLGSDQVVQDFHDSIKDKDPKLGNIVVSWIEKERSRSIKNPDSEWGKEARRLLENYIAAYPNSGMARRNLAEILWDQGDRAEALKYAQLAAELDPSSNNIYTCGYYYYKSDDYLAAMQVANMLIKKAPDDYRGYRLKGRINQFGLKNYPAAIEAYTGAIDRNSGMKATTRKRGDCLYFTGKYDEALADYEQSLDYDPDYGEAYYGIGRVYWKTNKPDEAEEAFALAVKYDSSLKKRVDHFKQSN